MRKFVTPSSVALSVIRQEAVATFSGDPDEHVAPDHSKRLMSALIARMKDAEDITPAATFPEAVIALNKMSDVLADLHSIVPALHIDDGEGDGLLTELQSVLQEWGIGFVLLTMGIDAGEITAQNEGSVKDINLGVEVGKEIASSTAHFLGMLHFNEPEVEHV
jgi:hypothetical protein